MARTFVRQTQISSSINPLDNLTFSQRENYALNGGTVKNELDVIRSTIKALSGESVYYSGSSGKSLYLLNLELSGALSTSADFLGNLSVAGTTTLNGNNIFGNNSSDFHQFSGSVSLLNNLFVDGLVTGSQLRIDGLGAGVAHLDANGNVTSSEIIDGDVASNAAIAGTKISPDFGNQNITTTGNITGSNGRITGDLTVIGDINSRDLNARTGSFSGDLTVTGNLTVNGTTVTLNTETLVVEDKNIVIASNAGNDTNANGAGITVSGSTDHTILYNSSSASWDFSENLLASSNNSKDLGSSGTKWKDLYLAGNANIGGDLSINDINASGYIVAEGQITSSLRVSAPFITGSTAVKAADIVISSGFISGASHVTMSAGGDLRFVDSRVQNGFTLTDASNSSLNSPMNSSTSIFGALNALQASIGGGGGVSHSKQILTFPGASTSTYAVSSSFDLSTGFDLQDDANIYINGVLIHASGSTTDETTISGVDASLKTGTTGTIVFAFALTNGDVITIEKF